MAVAAVELIQAITFASDARKRSRDRFLDIRPLLWKDGWPIAGENPKVGTYQFESLRTGTGLELAVEGFPVGGRPVRRGPPPAGSGGNPAAPGTGGGIFGGVGHPIP